MFEHSNTIQVFHLSSPKNLNLRTGYVHDDAIIMLAYQIAVLMGTAAGSFQEFNVIDYSVLVGVYP